MRTALEGYSLSFLARQEARKSCRRRELYRKHSRETLFFQNKMPGAACRTQRCAAKFQDILRLLHIPRFPGDHTTQRRGGATSANVRRLRNGPTTRRRGATGAETRGLGAARGVYLFAISWEIVRRRPPSQRWHSRERGPPVPGRDAKNRVDIVH